MNVRLIDWTDDALSRRCLEERDRIRRMIDDARAIVARWEPRPMPEHWKKARQNG
jgi:hypothetical protein